MYLIYYRRFIATLNRLSWSCFDDCCRAFLKYLNVVPKETQRGSKQLYKFISGNFTFPLMVGLGMLYIPLKDVVGMLSWQYFVVVISVVFTVIATGFFVSRFMNMNPVEAAIVSACQSGMGDWRCGYFKYSQSNELNAVCTSCDTFRRCHYSNNNDCYF